MHIKQRKENENKKEKRGQQCLIIDKVESAIRTSTSFIGKKKKRKTQINNVVLRLKDI